MNSVQQRLQLGLAASVVLLMLLLWWLVAGAIEKFGEEFVLSRLEHDADSVLSALQVDENGALQLTPGRMANIYKKPFSGHYFMVLSDGEALYSRSLWDESLAVSRLPKGEVRQWNMQGPAEQTLLVWAGGFQKQGQRFTLAVAEDLTPLSESLVRFNGYFAGLSLLTLMVLFGVQHYIIRRSFRPLEKILHEVKNLQQGAVGKLSEEVPTEVRPLVREVNHLLHLLGERLQRSRNALGNLAHALKGPLSLLSQLGQQENVRALPNLSASLKQQTDSIQQLMDRELKRARLMGQGVPGVRFAPQEEMPMLVNVLQRIFSVRDAQEKPLNIHWRAPEVVFVFDRDDMLELIGNLLDNACKWAKHQVRCELQGDEHHLQLVVEDDGPGCTDEEIKQLTARGVRIDEAAPGHGLGLAIVRDVVEIYSGRLMLGRSPTLGGLRVSVYLENRAVNGSE